MKTKLISAFLGVFLLCLKSAYAQFPTDCIDAVVICGNSNVNLNVNGIGTQELNGSNTCGSQENNSIWLQVTIETGGTLGFTLTPNSNSIREDYDFFIFGPNVACGNIGQAIRCSTTNPEAAGQGNNLTGMNGTETDTSEGPGDLGNSFVRWLDVLPGEAYYIVIDRPIGNSPFSLTWTGTAQFPEPPVIRTTTPQALNLESCDILPPFNDGFTTFNLEYNTANIIGSQTNVVVTYHLNSSDATINANPLTSPYTNVSNRQPINARITNTVTGCFEYIQFDLIVNSPDFNPPSPLVSCDTTDDGNSSNGQALFDLSSKNAEILNGQNPSNINISYHSSLNDAETNSNHLSNPYYNTTPNSQRVFVRIEDALNIGCFSTSTLDLMVNPLPEANDTTIIQCDEDGIPEGFTIFNLNQIFDDIIGGATDRSITYFLTNADAINNTNPINGDAFNNFFNPQTVIAKVTNDITGCSNLATLTLQVSTTSASNAFLNKCDDDGNEDGFFNFNLSDANSAVLSNLPAGLDLNYYETYEDALLEQNPLLTNYTNATAYNQTIFARVENSNACYGISRVSLSVYRLPRIETALETFYCLNSFPETITLSAGVIGDSPSNYYYLWSTGETTSKIMTNEPGTYTVRVTNGDGCFKDRTIIVLPSNTATITDIEITDAAENNTVTVFVTGVGDYEYVIDTINGPYQDSNIFNNVSPGLHTVYVRDKNKCGIVNQLISVIGFPKYFTPNGDTYHDYWQVYGISPDFQSKTLIHIFDRKGKLLKELDPLTVGWDGTFNGNLLPADDYWFVVSFIESGTTNIREFKGHFTLKR